VRDTGLTAADAWAIADDRSTWRALRPIAGYAQQWVSECGHSQPATETSTPTDNKECLNLQHMYE